MFNFVRKLFKALNSSGKAWQLSGAIVLAMFAGFLPVGSLLLFDLFFLALILNVNFGLFLLFSVIFSGVGYIFDPLFESIGYSVLTNDGLNSFFTGLYNSAIFRWSAFNYTLVTGALVVSSVLALPVLFILNKVVTLYRVQIGQKLNEWKFTRWMNIFNDEVKSTSVFRWWGLGVFGGLAAFIIVLIIFVFDPVARVVLEKTLSYSLQTQVDIQNFNSSFSDLEVEVNGLEVADKDKLSHNLVQVKNIRFDLGFSALMEKKVMIDFLDVNGLAFNEKRKTPAKAYAFSLKEVASTQASEAKTATKAALPSFSVPSVDDILNKEELASVTEAQKLRKDIETTQAKWKKISSDLKKADEVNAITSDAKKLQESLKHANISQIASAKKDIDKLEAKINTLQNKYTKLQKEFKQDQKRLQKEIKALKSLPQKDINRLMQKYSLNASGGANVIGTLVSAEVGAYVKKALKYYEMLSPYLNDNSTPEVKDVKPPRGQGRWVKYANLSKIPEFVIKEAKINVLLKEDALDVQIKDLSSNQKLYGKPMKLHADAQGKQYKSIRLNVLDDRRGEVAKTNFDLKAKAFKKADLEMQGLRMSQIVSDMSAEGKIENMQVQAKSLVQVKQVKMQMDSQELVNKMLADISHFKVNIEVEGSLEKPSIHVSSDLGKQLSKGVKSMASKEAKAFEKKLTQGVFAKAGDSSKGLSTDLGDTGSLLDNKQDALGGINLDFGSGSDFMKKLF